MWTSCAQDRGGDRLLLPVLTAQVMPGCVLRPASTRVRASYRDRDRRGELRGELDEQNEVASNKSGFKSGSTHEVRA